MHKKDITKKILSMNDLKTLREENKNKKFVFTVGCYDILHHGHVKFFYDCAKLGDIFIVGLGKDSTVKILKGQNRPVNKEQNRLYVIASLESVDYVLLNEEMIETGRKEEYLRTKIDFKEILEKLRPDIFVLGEDTIESETKKLLCKSLGIKTFVLEKDTFENTSQISTSEMVRELGSEKR